MAIINLDEIADSVRPYLKKDTYTARILSAEFTQSKAGAPMIVMQWELAAPEQIEDGMSGKVVRIAGLQFRDYLSFSENAKEYRILQHLIDNVKALNAQPKNAHILEIIAFFTKRAAMRDGEVLIGPLCIKLRRAPFFVL